MTKRANLVAAPEWPSDRLLETLSRLDYGDVHFLRHFDPKSPPPFAPTGPLSVDDHMAIGRSHMRRLATEGLAWCIMDTPQILAQYGAAGDVRKTYKRTELGDRLLKLVENGWPESV